MGTIEDNTVCVSSNDDECFVDDVTCLANNCNVVDEGGEIPYDDDKPQVEVEVPENQLGDVTEYSFGYWFRFHYRIPTYLPINIARNNFLA